MRCCGTRDKIRAAKIYVHHLVPDFGCEGLKITQRDGMPTGSHRGIVDQNVQCTQLPGNLRNSRIDGINACLINGYDNRLPTLCLYCVTDRFGTF